MANQLLAELEALQKAKDNLQKDYQEAVDKINNMELDIDQAQEIIIELQQKIDKAIKYIKNYTLIGELDGQKVIMNEFHILASPKELLEILGDKDE